MTSRRYDPDSRRAELMGRIEDDIPPGVAQALREDLGVKLTSARTSPPVCCLPILSLTPW